MNIIDIIGPVMVGPSSSHTAGAVKIGFVCRQLLREDIRAANLKLHGSFLATGKGHGTDKALIAGLLGMRPDDERIPDSLQIARARGMQYTISGTELKNVHPNTVLLSLKGIHGKQLDAVASSIGGGAIKICLIDGTRVNINADYPTLIIHNVDQPGHVSAVTSLLGNSSVNIATMQLYRDKRGETAVMVIECDEEIPEDVFKRLNELEGVIKTTYLSLEEANEFSISE